MPASVHTDFRIIDDDLHRGVVEELDQRIDLFNAETLNSIRLVDERVNGHQEHNVSWKDFSDAISWRDIGSTADVADKKIEEIDEIAIKINRAIDPRAVTGDALRKSLRGFDNDLSRFSADFGGALGRHMPKDMLNTALLAVSAALEDEGSNFYDATVLLGNEAMEPDHLVEGLYTMGDAADSVVAWIMHSHVAKTLLKESISANRQEVTAFSMFEGSIATIGKPAFITDSSGLIRTGTPNEYITLGLVADGVIIKNAEEEDMMIDKISGKANILYRIQGEFAYTIGLKGMAWAGAINPQNAALSAAAAWSRAATYSKGLPGVAIRTQ